MQNHLQAGDKVQLKYRLCADERRYCDESFWFEPVLIEIGKGEIDSWIETVLLSGETRYTLSAEQVQSGFGDYDQGKYQLMQRADFESDIDLKPGLIVAFSTPTGEELAGRVDDFNEEFVAVDFNHPFAGTEVVLEVDVHKL